MTQRLDRVRVKLARAETHLDAIRHAVETIRARGPELIPGEFDTREHRFVFLAQHDSARGDWLGPMIGDCVHNFRAALDYLVWELSSPTYRSTHGTRIEFPISADPAWYRSASAKAKVGGLDHAARRIVECLQPFNGPDCRQRFDLAHPTDKPLWNLLELDNWDKHRSLNLTEDVASMHLRGFEELAITAPSHPVRFGTTFRRGTPLVFVNVPLGSPEAQVSLEVTYDVEFDRSSGPESVRGEPVVGTLDRIRDEIYGRVLPALEGHLPPD